jgi:hypothetical protein
MSRNGQRPPQQAVRVARFEATLDRFNSEIGEKTAFTLAKFHEMYVAPLEQRIAELETPWYRRMWHRLTAWTEMAKAEDRL